MKKQFVFVYASIVFGPLAVLAVAILMLGDYELFTFINQNMANTALDFACIYMSPTLFSAFYVLALVSHCFSRDSVSKANGIVSVINGFLSYGVGSLIKVLVERPRPDVFSTARIIPEARIIGLWHSSIFSFPSTTTMLAFGLSLPILLEKPRCGIILVALSYFMGFSVIYTGYHFPIDVTAGVLFSLAITLGTERIKNPIVGLLEKYKPKRREIEAT